MLLVLALVAGVVAFFVIDSRVGLRAAPTVAHEEVLDPASTIRMALKPERGFDFIRELVVSRAPDTPDWAMSLGLPREIAVTMEMSEADPRFDVALFMNPSRFGPTINQMMGPAMLQNTSEVLEWSPPGLSLIRPGVLQGLGTYAIDGAIVQEWERDWEVGGRRSELPFSGEHLLEMNIDNRDNILFVLAKASILDGMGENERTIVYDVIRANSSINLTLDPAGAEGFDLVLTMHTREDAKEGAESLTRNLIGLGIMAARPQLLETYGLTMDGKAVVEGRDVVGRYTLGPRERVIGMLLGEALPAAAEPAS